MYADFFTKPLQGSMLWRLRDMIQGIPKSTPNVDMICPRSMAKFTSQDCSEHNNIQTHGTATAIMDSCRIPCTDTQTCRSTIKDSSGITCTEDRVSACTHFTCTEYCVSACTDVSTEITGMHRSTCLYISAKVMGVNGVTSTDEYTVKTVVCGITSVYDK